MNKEAENDRRRAMKPDDGVDGFFFIFTYEHIVICSNMLYNTITTYNITYYNVLLH